MKKILILIITFCLTSLASAFEVTNKNINDLKFGKTNSTVRDLQLFLNENGFYESEEGPGSPGNETEYFGKSTEAAVKIFQEYYEMPITGKVDFATGRAINEYAKELKEEEETYISTEEYANDKAVDITDRYGLGTSLDEAYSSDLIDSYLPQKSASEDSKAGSLSQTNKNTWTLKSLLERSTNTFPKNNSVTSTDNTETETYTVEQSETKTTKSPTLFERFFSLFK